MKLSPTLLLTAVGLAGCIDLVEPVPPPRIGPARLMMHAELLAGEEWEGRNTDGTLVIHALLDPGADSAGVPRGVANGVLRVLDAEIAPLEVSNGTWQYEAEFELDLSRVPAMPIIFEFPDLAGADFDPSMLRWYAIGRADPDTIEVVRGEDLVLTLEVPGAESLPASATHAWSLDLTHAEGVVLRMLGRGMPPPVLVVPANLLADEAAQELTARLTTRMSVGSDSPAADYLVFADLGVRFRWTIHLTEPPVTENR